MKRAFLGRDRTQITVGVKNVPMQPSVTALRNAGTSARIYMRRTGIRFCVGRPSSVISLPGPAPCRARTVKCADNARSTVRANEQRESPQRPQPSSVNMAVSLLNNSVNFCYRRLIKAPVIKFSVKCEVIWSICK